MIYPRPKTSLVEIRRHPDPMAFSRFGHLVSLSPDEARALLSRLYRENGAHLPSVAAELEVGLKSLYRYVEILGCRDALAVVRESLRQAGRLKVSVGRRLGRKDDRPRKKRQITPEHRANISTALKGKKRKTESRTRAGSVIRARGRRG
jgi:hypothetical protein